MKITPQLRKMLCCFCAALGPMAAASAAETYTLNGLPQAWPSDAASPRIGLDHPAVGNNAVELDGIDDADATLYGSYAGPLAHPDGGSAGNQVTLSGSTLLEVYGGRGAAGGAVGNEASLLAGSCAVGNAFGGHTDARASGASASALGTARGNVLRIGGGSQVLGSARGASSYAEAHGDGAAATALAEGNSVQASGQASLGDRVYGAYSCAEAKGASSSAQASAQGNSITYSEQVQAANGNNFAGHAFAEILEGGHSAEASVSGNSFILSGGSHVEKMAGGGYSRVRSSEDAVLTLTASGNSITLRGASSVASTIMGGYCELDDNSADSAINVRAEGNRVLLEGASTAEGSVHGAFLTLDSGGSTAPCTALAEGNSVTISEGSTVQENITGARIQFKGAGNFSNLESRASGNSVTVINSTVLGSIYGARVDKGSATGNSITIIGPNCGLEGAHLYGGRSGDGEQVQGNRISFVNFQGKVAGLHNAEALHFTLSGWNPAAPVIELTGSSSDLDCVQVLEVELGPIAPHAPAPEVGGTVELIANARTPSNAPLTLQGAAAVKQGISTLYRFEAEGNNKLVVAGKRTNPQTKALSEGRVAAMALDYRAADLVAEQGMARAGRAAGGLGLSTFVAGSAGHSCTDSGSHVDVDGLSFLVGATAAPAPLRGFSLGAFAETGWGQYSTHNRFADMPAVRGTGESSYCGGGLLLGYAPTALHGFAVDASLRAGRQQQDFSSTDLHDGLGHAASYRLSSSYIAGHVGMSYRLEPTATLSTTLYARYLWSRLGADAADICGERFRFDALESHRLRFGARAAWQAAARWTPYAGLAYEWECSGTARASVGEGRPPAPSMRGGSAIGELGLIWQPREDKALWVQGGFHASVGKVQGYGAGMSCTLSF